MHSLLQRLGVEEPGQLRWLWVSIVVLALDQATKLTANALLLYHSVDILPVFSLNLAYNEGAAWSILQDASGWQRWFFMLFAVVVSGVLINWLKKLTTEERLSAIAFALVIGGALGNASDRLFHGHVIDFIQVYYRNWFFPTFNVADSAITIGVALMLWDNFFQQRQGKEAQ